MFTMYATYADGSVAEMPLSGAPSHSAAKEMAITWLASHDHGFTHAIVTTDDLSASTTAEVFETVAQNAARPMRNLVVLAEVREPSIVREIPANYETFLNPAIDDEYPDGCAGGSRSIESHMSHDH